MDSFDKQIVFFLECEKKRTRMVAEKILDNTCIFYGMVSYSDDIYIYIDTNDELLNEDIEYMNDLFESIPMIKHYEHIVEPFYDEEFFL